MNSLERFRSWYQKHEETIRKTYFDFLQFASISADRAYRDQVLACANFLASYLKNHHIQAELIPTSGYPIVYAEEKSSGSGKKTLLMYGHYDVQPVDPENLWITPPFSPTERDGKIFARGATDNKGQIFYAILAVLAWKDLYQTLPVNIKFCIEGEEESHSKGLLSTLPSLKEKLQTDGLLIVDFESAADGSPAVTLGARGCVALEITLRGSNQDLHSGSLGGLAYNPNRALAEIVAKLWDSNGRVAIPKFYDGIEHCSEKEMKTYHFALDEKMLEKEFAIRALSVEKGKTLKESNWFFPTLELNGMYGGYTGDGNKTIIPAEAHVKISCRLVPGQNPQRVLESIGTFFKTHAPKGIDVQVTYGNGVSAYRSDMNDPLAVSVAKAAAEVTGKKCLYVLSGASIPVAADLMRTLQAPAIGMGFGLPTDQAHSPNEHFDMNRLQQGFLTVARTIELFA